MDGQRGAPLRLQNIETNLSAGVDVWMVDLSCKANFWRFEWVVAWELYTERFFKNVLKTTEKGLILKMAKNYLKYSEMP